MTNDNNTIDDFDTQIHSDEIYDYDDLAMEYDSGSPIDTDRMERESEWMYPSDLEGYECPEFDS